MKYAVIKTGGKQYLVAPGDTLRVEKLAGEYKKGDTVTFDEVLLTEDGNETTLGAPLVKGGAVTATFEGEGKGKKVTVIKYRPKSRYFKKRGHRQPYASVKIVSIG